ncbi:MAG: hypothetical protein HGA22_00290 [Clostridiales bacterium]|nr:hypothetical protein [Clostridiales bacterium]
MQIYILVVIAFIVITTAMFVIISKRSRKSNMPVVIAVAGGSLLAGLVFPAVFNGVSQIAGLDGDTSQIGTAFAISMGVYALGVFALALILAATVFRNRIIFTTPAEAGAAGTEAIAGQADAFENAAVDSAAGTVEPKQNLLEQLYGNIISDQKTDLQLDMSSPEIAETPAYKPDITEKSVDSEENIDKMGLENEITDIGEFIEEAFQLKEKGDLEGAALYYMYVLDRKPSKQLIFWIVLDICVLYKELGQKTLAMDILSGYAERYSDIMNEDVRMEIERNLFL